MIRKINGAEFPLDYLEFMKEHNGGDGFVADAYVFLFKMEELIEINEDYCVEEYLPNACIIGSDGGGELFGIDKDGNYFIVPAIIDEDDKINLGTSLHDLIVNFAKTLNGEIPTETYSVGMFISSNLGTIQCTAFSDYERNFKECLHHLPSNEIWCSRNGGSDDYPCLSILVKGEDAVVNYFSENNAEMFVSVGDLSREGSVGFEGGQYEIAAYQVIPLNSALECALQFFYSQKKPSCMEWDEL